MKKIILVLLSIILTQLTNAQLSDSDAFFSGTYDRMFIKSNKIKQINIETRIEKNKSSYHIFNFDKKGYLKKQTVLDSSWNTINIYKFKYNNYGDQIERTTIVSDANKINKVTFIKTYKDSILISEKSSELPFLTEYTYNSNGNIKEKTTISNWDSLNNSKRILFYNYDTTNNLQNIEESMVYSDGTKNILKTTTFSYDSNGKVVSIERTNSSTYYFSYESNGFIKSKRIEMPDEYGKLEILETYCYIFW